MFNKIEYTSVANLGMAMAADELNDGWDNYHICGNVFYFKRVVIEVAVNMPKFNTPPIPNKKKK